MLVNRDPDGKPQVTEAMLQRARELRYHLVNVICDEPGAKVGDHTCISFIALVPFLPRSGDRITLENGRTCEVRTAYFKVVKAEDDVGSADAILLMPNVIAYLLP